MNPYLNGMCLSIYQLDILFESLIQGIHDSVLNLLKVQCSELNTRFSLQVNDCLKRCENQAYLSQDSNWSKKLEYSRDSILICAKNQCRRAHH